MSKTSRQGRLTGIQPRIRLARSFDQGSHAYLGYCLFIHGNIGSETGGFGIGIGKSAQDKFQLRSGDIVSGESEPLADEKKASVLLPTKGFMICNGNRGERSTGKNHLVF
ncbi:MAG: hypothetical protein ABSD38_12265 [Syntrophorhabdales bacterium]